MVDDSTSATLCVFAKPLGTRKRNWSVVGSSEMSEHEGYERDAINYNQTIAICHGCSLKVIYMASIADCFEFSAGIQFDINSLNA